MLEAQDGVISRRAARLGGLSEDAWQWRLDSGRWQGVLPGVAVAHSGQVTALERSWAGVLHAGEGAALSGDAGLISLGAALPEPAVVDVAIPEQRRVRGAVLLGPTPVRLRAHRVRGLETHVHPVRRPPVLRAAYAVLHAAAWAASDRAAEWRVAAAVQQRLIRPSDLREALAACPTLRRRGLVGEVLDDVELGAHAASELDLLRFLRRGGLPAPDQLQRPVRPGGVRYLDAWWERQRVTVEVDGAHHRLVGTWEADVMRGNDVVLAERHDRMLLLRYTRGNLRHDEAAVHRQLRTALA